MNHQEIPRATPGQRKNLEIVFLKAFGKTYNKIRKEDMAFMIVNQSMNNKKLTEDMIQMAGIGLAMKRQRDYYLKLIRSKT